MLEMFTDNDPMRNDDFKFPADGCYNGLTSRKAKSLTPRLEDAIITDDNNDTKSDSDDSRTL